MRRNVERRRRVLIDASAGDSDSGAASEKPGQAARRPRYAEEARSERQPHITALIPTRRWSWTLVILAGLSGVAGLISLYGWFTVLQPEPRLRGLLDPAQPGSLPAWCAGMLLLVGAAACGLAFLQRRHRIDDYRGGYRYWIWAGLVFVLASIDATTSTHQTIDNLVGPTGPYWRMGAWSLLMATVFVVLGPEILSSLGAACALTIACAGYLTAAAIRLDFLLPPGQPLTQLCAATAILLAHASLVAAAGLYARYVFLDAHGLVPERVPRTKNKRKQRARSAEKTETETAADAESAEEESAASTRPAKRRKKRSDLEAPEAAAQPKSQTKSKPKPESSKPARPKLARPSAEAEENESDSGSGEGEADSPTRPLSKAERRRLRKQQRRRAA